MKLLNHAYWKRGVSTPKPLSGSGPGPPLWSETTPLVQMQDKSSYWYVRVQIKSLGGGSRVGVVGVATPPFIGLGVKAQGLEKPLCAHFQYLIKITKQILDEVRHLAAKLQTRDQDIFVA